MDRNHPALRVFALVAFLALLAGATALAYDAIDRGGFPAQAHPVIGNRTTSPGHTVSFPVALEPLEAEPVEVGISASAPSGLEAEAPPTTTASGPNGTGFWVEVDVPDGADLGTHEVRLDLEAGGATRTLFLPVSVEEPDRAVEVGDTVDAKYVARFPNGSVFATNVRAVDESPIPRTPRYSSPSYGPIAIPTSPEAQFVPGLKEGVVGAGVGHDLTVHLSPDQAYGNETERVEEPRTETVDRIIEERRRFNLSRQKVAQQGLINESSEEGDRITLGQGDRQRVYLITFLNETQVTLTADVSEGDQWTHYPAWPDSSTAVDVNDTRIRYRVDPPVEAGESFTWYDHWPNATTITAMNDTRITLRHTVPEGLNYTKQVENEPVEHQVVEVRDDAIVAERPNQAPLAGQTLVFDLTIQKIQ